MGMPVKLHIVQLRWGMGDAGMLFSRGLGLMRMVFARWM